VNSASSHRPFSLLSEEPEGPFGQRSPPPSRAAAPAPLLFQSGLPVIGDPVDEPPSLRPLRPPASRRLSPRGGEGDTSCRQPFPGRPGLSQSCLSGVFQTAAPGSKLPTCYFASFQIASVPVRPFGSATALRIAPVAATSLPVARCTSTTRFGLPRLPSPLPSGTFASLGIKAFNSLCCLPVHLTNPPDFLSLPAARPD
jgi:hypothetical protein